MSNKNKSKSSKNKGSSDKKGKKKESKKSSAMSMVKSIVLALLLALLVRVFIFEMFKIPSCSMEPTLEGVDMSHGDRVGVSKLSYMFGKVNRYDVLVFSAETVINGKKYNRDYIKRVAGFENEKLELRAGDLYVNDDIAPKPHDVQQSVWIPVYSEDFEDYSEESDGRFWSADGARMNVADGAMHIEGGSVSYEHWNRVLNNGTYLYGYITNLVPRLSLLDGVICPSTRKRFEPHYKDLYYESDVGRRSVDRGFICPQTGERIPYDGERGDTSQPLRGEMGTDFWLGGRSVVGDLAFEADITPQVPTGSITVTIGRGQETSTRYFPQSIALPIGGGFEPVFKNIDGSTPLAGSAILKEGVTTHVSFEVWDGRVRVEFDGKKVLETEFILSGRDLDGNLIRVSLGDSTRITLDNVTIKRDIYYLAVDIDQSVNPYLVSKGIYKVPEGRLFMLGDNSAASNDCRLKLMPVPLDDVVGRAFAVIWPLSRIKWLPSGGE